MEGVMQSRFGRLVLGLCLAAQGVMFRAAVSAASTPAESLPLSQIAALAPLVVTDAGLASVPLNAGTIDGDIFSATARAPAAPESALALNPTPAGPPFEVRVGLSAERVEPGAEVRLFIVLGSAVALTDAEVLARLPDGLAYVGADDAAPEIEAGTLRWRGVAVAAGAVTRLSVLTRVGDEPGARNLAVRVSAQSAAAGVGETGRATIRVGVPLAPQWVGARGGTALVSGRIRLTFGAGAVAADTPIRMTQYAETIGVDGEASEPVVAQFSAEPGMVFGAAVTASFDLAGLIPNDRVAQLRTVYFEPLTRTLRSGAVVTETVRRTEAIPLAFVKDGVFEARLEHFSNFEVTAAAPNPKAWTPSFTDAATDRFSGGLSWSYGFGLPAGPGDVAGPGLALSYGSRSMDGLKERGQSDGVGYGWNIDTAEIYWAGVQPHYVYNNWRMGWSPRLMLSLNGRNTRILADDASVPLEWNWEAAWQYGKAFTGTVFRGEDDAFSRITWKYRTPDDGYWDVTTRDGVRYEFGATEDSRFTTRAPAWSYWTQPGYTDKTTRWRLNRVVYPSGGEVSYTYWKQRYTDQCDLFKSREWSGTDQCETPNFVSNTTDRASYISEIGYGQTKVAFDWAYRKDVASLNDGFAEQAWKAWPANGMWALSWQTHALTGVRVLQRDSSGVWQTTQRWALEHAIHEPSGADSQPLRVLAGIRAYGLNGAAQPAVTFGYTGYPNWAQWWPDPSKDWSAYGYPYPRLSAIDAGTGATITIQYETPDTLYLGRQNPDLGYNYRVVTKTVGDGLGGGSIEAYGYPATGGGGKERCYMQTAEQWGCTWPDAHDYFLFPDGNGVYNYFRGTGGQFVGYLWTERQARDLRTNQVLGRDRQTFHLPEDGVGGSWALRGKPRKVETQDGGGAVIATTATSWTTASTMLTRTAVPISALAWVTQEERSMDGRTTRTRHAVDGYGRATWTWEDGDTEVAGDERSTLRTYPTSGSASAWILDGPASEKVFAGTVTTDTDSCAVVGEARLYYDDATSIETRPTLGRLTRLEQGYFGTACAGRGLTTTLRYVYAAAGNLIERYDPSTGSGQGQRAEAYGYDGSWTRLLTVTNALSQTVTYAYYGVSGEAVTNTPAFAGAGYLGAVQPVGALKAVTDANQAVTMYGYDGLGRLTVVAGPPNGGGATNLGQWSTVYAYTTDYTSAAGLPRTRIVETVCENEPCATYNHLTVSYFDGLGRRVQTHEESAEATQMRVTHVAYDGLGRTISRSVPITQTSATSYTDYLAPAWGGLIKTQTAYDELGRAMTVTAVDGTLSVARYGIDANGPGYTGTNLALKTTIDPNGHQKQQVSDALGRMVRVREFDGTGPPAFAGAGYTVTAETRYVYDAADRLTTVTDTLGNVTAITYDALGRKVGMIDPDMGAWSYGYNLLGQLITQTDALSQTMVFAYDALGRMTSKGVGGANPSGLASYLYDQGANGIGRRSRMTDTTGYSAWTYDLRGRVIEARKWVNPNPGVYVTTFGYDAANRLISNTLPGGTEVVTTTYDAAGQPYSLFAGGRSLVQSAAYNALGAPTRVSFGNGLDKVNQYFGLDYTAPSWAWSPLMAYGRLRSTCVITASQTCSTDRMDALLNTVFWYDKVGNVTTVRDNVLNSEMLASYDALGRLVTATTVPSLTTMSELAPMTETYAYNAIGNLTGRYGVSATGAITYPAAGSARPHAAIETANGNSYSYDANGNMTVRREKLEGIAYVYTQTWTIDNRLARVTKTDLTGTVLAVTSFYYDGDGVCVRKDDPDGSVLYVGALEQTIGAPGTATVEYFEDIAGTATLSGFVSAHGEPVAAGLTRFFTSAPPLPSMGGEPYGLRWQVWLTVPVTDTYTFAVYADDGFTFSGYGLVVSNTTAQVAITKESALSLTLSAGVPYNFSLTYLNYSPTTAGVVQLLWRRAGGSLEIVPVEALHARTRREYFSFGGAIVAMKDGVLASGTIRTLTYLHGDHIRSASLTTDASGQKVSEQRYKPYGEVRWSSGAGMPTDKQFTSQTRLAEGYVGTLYDYVARAYDPALGRFVSVDTVVPDMWDPQYLNRYAYVRNNPLLRGDPDGHCPICVTALIGAAVGAVIGAATVALPAMISNIQNGQPLMTNIDPAEVGKAAAVGAVAGLVAGATMGIGTAVLGTGFGATVATGAVSGVIAGQAGKATGNVIDGNDIGSGLLQPEDMVRDGALGALGAAGGYAIGKVAGRLTSAGTVCSFSPDTPVATETGYVPIAGVITGTRVLAWDETANATGYFPVTHVWVHSDPVLVVLVVNGETITTTPEHPFYTPMHGWLPAGELWAGAGLRRADGGAGVVESTMTLTRTERMWNLTVDVAHTYFVGGGEWLVHNAGCVRPGQPGKPDHQATVAKLRSMATDEWRADPMVEIVENVSIRGATGVNRIPDVSAWRGKDVVKVYEAARVNKYGGLVQREQLKMLEYFDNDVRYFFLEVK